MIAIQLPLWGEMPQASTPTTQSEEKGIFNDGKINYLMVDPCKTCPFYGLCAADDCGAHLFDLDVNEPETMPFKDWLCEPWNQ